AFCRVKLGAMPIFVARGRKEGRMDGQTDIAIRFCHSGPGKDYALPNSSWSKDMTSQFNKFMEMSKSGLWQRISSHRRLMYEHEEQKTLESDSRFFCRNLDVEGLGFEYVMFWNQSEKRMICIFQPGPYLEGYTGFVHGGCIATIIDNAFIGCALFTANLDINYKAPLPLGSVVLVDTKVDKTEGRKTFISGTVQRADGKMVYAHATLLFIHMDPQTSSQLEEASKL
uniref:Acyl-coenzyme A thioesterase THEM4 n=1 Tax=Salvator merianae TaxID=96440 RepID=A0A8D0E8V3_SALMN